MRTIAACCTLLLWLIPALALGQSQPDLLVVVRDVDGRGVPGVTVAVRDQAGREVYAGLTDAQGQVAVEHVPSPELRVAVSGVAGGVELVQRGDDAGGVLIFLAAPPLVLELRVDSGGVVVPGPSMLALEPVDVPTAQIGAASVSPGLPVAALPTPVDAGSRPAGALEPTRQGTGGGWGVLIGVFGITAVLAAIVAVLLHERRVA